MTRRRKGSTGVLARALSGALSFDTSALAIWPGLRAALGIAALLTIGLAVSGPAAAASMGAGALLAGTASISGGSRPPLVAMGGVTATMAVSTFVGSATGHLGWLHLALLAPWAFAAAMLVALGPTASSIGVQAVMAIVIFGQFAAAPLGALELAGLVALGGVGQIVLATFLRAPITAGVQRRSVAGAYRALADLAHQAATGLRIEEPGGPAREVSGIASAEQLDEASRTLTVPMLLGRGDIGPLQSLIDLGRRMRLELLAIVGLGRQLARRTGAQGPVLAVARRALGEANDLLALLAGLLEDAAVAPDSPLFELSSASGMRRAIRPDPASAPATPSERGGAELDDAVTGSLVDHVAALAGQLRAATATAEQAREVRAVPTLAPAGLVTSLHPLVGVRTAAAIIAANLSLSSPTLRHGLRMAVVLPVAEVIAEHAPFERGYWIALTAGVVLKPDFASTFTRGVARVLGTLVGVGLAGMLAVGLHPSGAATVAAIGLLAWGAYALLWVNYASFSCLLTALVVLLLSLVSNDSLGTAGDRFEATLVGGGLALLAYRVWPTWSRAEAGASIEGLLGATRTYLGDVLHAATGLGGTDQGRLSADSRRVRLARTDAEAAVARSLSEPASRRLDPGITAGVLSALRRMAVATHGLRAGLGASVAVTSPAAAAAFVEAVDDALGLTGPAVRAALARTTGPDGPDGPDGPAPRTEADREAPGDVTEGAPRPLPPLRALHDDLLEASLEVPGAAGFLAATDEVVDAIDTLGSLVGLARGFGADPSPPDEVRHGT